jgi:hypothetical protein
MSVNRKVTVPVGESAMRLESSLPSHYSTVASPSEIMGVEVMRHSYRAAESLGGLGCGRVAEGVRLLRAGFAPLGKAWNRPSAEVDVA